MKISTLFKAASTVLLLGVIFGCAWAQDTGRAAIKPPDQRQLASALRLRNASGKKVSLSDYQGQVVLLDFWATTCGGCKIEIPWYVEFQSTYGRKGLSVLGVSMDMSYEELKSTKEAWSLVVPFAEQHTINYPILMGDDQAANAFAIKALPATFLIDRNGHIAATYMGVLADKNNVETNIETLLAEKQILRIGQ